MFDFNFLNRFMIIQNPEKGFIEAVSHLHRQTTCFHTKGLVISRLHRSKTEVYVFCTNPLNPNGYGKL